MAAKTEPQPLAWELVKAKKKPATADVTIAADSRVVDAYDTAVDRRRLVKADLDRRPDDRALRAKLQDLEDQLEHLRADVDKASITFTFQALGRADFEDLLDQHPPTKTQRDKAEKAGQPAPRWDADTFPPALVAAAAVSPRLSETEAKELFADPNWSEGELLALFFGALSLNQRGGIDHFLAD